jgi:hypothetical protein
MKSAGPWNQELLFPSPVAMRPRAGRGPIEAAAMQTEKALLKTYFTLI